MLNRFLLVPTVVAAVAIPDLAEASPSWHLSPVSTNDNGACAAVGDGIRTQIGYYGETTPKTGDNPDSAVVVVVQNGWCGPVTVIPSFRLPPEVAQDASQAVECYRAPNGGMNQPLSSYPSNEGACSTTPLAVGIPNVFGWSRLNAGQRLEIYIPVAYIKQMTNGQFSVLVQNNFSPLTPVMNFNVDYRALFANYVSSWVSLGSYYDETQLTFAFRLDHFHVAGQLFVDYGTTTSLGSTSLLGTTDAQYRYYPNLTSTVGGLAAGTTYYWRPRIVTSFGTFVGATQSAQTCWRRSCRALGL